MGLLLGGSYCGPEAPKVNEPLLCWQGRANGTSMALSMDNHSLDLRSVVSGIRIQFEEIAQRDKVEAELLYQTKVGISYLSWASLGVKEALACETAVEGSLDKSVFVCLLEFDGCLLYKV